MRQSTIQIRHDAAGEYETEVFDCDAPKAVVVCAHGNGVRRWDGERFFYGVAEHYPQHVFLLADQCQVIEGGCGLNSREIMTARVQQLVDQARADYPGVPLIVLGHSMGCGIASGLNLAGVQSLIFVAPAAGEVYDSLIKRYGPNIVDGKVVTTSDGLIKGISKAYVDSMRGVVWENEYRQLLTRYPNVHVFESGAEEIVGEERLAHRDLPFASYEIIPGATHNVHGEALQTLFTKLDGLL